MPGHFALTAILCLFGGLVAAAQTAGNGATSPATPGIAIGTAVVNAQGIAQIDVTLTSAGQAIAGVQFDIQYQYPVGEFAVTLGGASGSAGKDIWTSELQPTLKRVLIVGLNQAPIGDGVIATLLVPVPAGVDSGLYPLAISNAVATTGDAIAVSVTASGGGAIVPGNGVLAPTVTAVVNAASYAAGAVAPGEIVVISGNSLGAVAINTLQLTSAGTVASSLGGTRVLFDGIPAPVVYTTQSQVAVVVPYEIDGHTETSVQVEFQAIRSAPFSVEVTGTSPGIFTLDQSGQGQGAAINHDGTLNGPENPAPKGSVVSIYGTGEGQTAPPGVDGTIVDPANPRQPLLPVLVSIGGQSAEVVYVGSAGGQISGLLQANVRVPATAPSGSVQVTLTIGGGSSQVGVTVALQ
jgi:uncharacterized protein (TIGR03437 family)